MFSVLGFRQRRLAYGNRTSEDKNMNTFLYIGLGLSALGFILFIVSVAMVSHYEQKLYEVNQKIKALNKKAERIL